jgi:hypothetical protein
MCFVCFAFTFGFCFSYLFVYFGDFSSIICVFPCFGLTLARTFCSLRDVRFRSVLHAKQANRLLQFIPRILIKHVLSGYKNSLFVFLFFNSVIYRLVLPLFRLVTSVFSLLPCPARNSYGYEHKLLQLVEIRVGKSDCYQSICLLHSLSSSFLLSFGS